MSWLDKPFFDLISQINSLLPYFMTQTRYLAGLVLLFNVSLTFIKYAITHQGLKNEIVKTLTGVVMFVIIMSLYPTIINGLNTIVYKWSMGSTYTSQVRQLIDKTQNDHEFWRKKGDKADTAYSDIIKKIEQVDGTGQVGYKYVLDLYLDGTGYFSPNAVMRVIMLIMDRIWTQANKVVWYKDFGNWLLTGMTAILVLVCGAFAAAQYFIAAFEFQFIMAVGVITLPGMLWNSTKFMTEKFIGAIFGFFLKLLFVSISLMLMATGYLAMMTREFTGTLDQIVYIVFMSIIYLMICQNGPKLAVSLLTGTPQMSLMEGAASAGMLAGGAFLAAKGGAKGATSIAGGGAKTIGSSVQAIKDSYTSTRNSGGGIVKSVAAGLGAGLLAGGASTAHSMAKTAGSVLNSAGKFLLGRKTENKHSSLEKFRNGKTGSADGSSDNAGDAKSVTGYLAGKFKEGQSFSAGKFSFSAADFSRGKATSPSGFSAQTSFAKTEQRALPPAPQREGLPPPSSTPTVLMLPPPEEE